MSDPRENQSSLILASASSARKSLLSGAGVVFFVEPAHIDEAELKRSLSAEQVNAEDAAVILAEVKAQKISLKYPGALVLGADQMLDCNNVWFDKPPDKDHLAAQLTALRGKTHSLYSALVLVRDGTRIWHTVSEAKLTMRAFSDAFLASYLDASGPAELESVGGYRLEGAGSQLFSKIEGDYFTILGLPLLPLLDFLRHQGLVER